MVLLLLGLFLNHHTPRYLTRHFLIIPLYALTLGRMEQQQENKCITLDYVPFVAVLKSA